jgi:hypothetical protein
LKEKLEEEKIEVAVFLARISPDITEQNEAKPAGKG